MLRETWTQCPFMFTTFCAAGACNEELSCASIAQPSCATCTEPDCPCWSFYKPPLTRIVVFISWYLAKLKLGREIDDETAFALGRAVGWLSSDKEGPKILTDEEVGVYVRQLPDTFKAGLEHSNANFFEEGGSFLGSASSYSPTRQ